MRFASSPDLSTGGFPSKTYTGLIPLVIIRMVRLKRPWMCEVTSPASFVSMLDCPVACSAERTATRNWYIAMDASIATLRPVYALMS